MLTVRATGMKFVSIADNNNFICREWTIVKDYHIDGMSLVKSVNNSRFKKCWSFNNSIYKTYSEYGLQDSLIGDLEAVDSNFGFAVDGRVPIWKGHDSVDIGNDVLYKEEFEWTALAVNTMSLIADLLMLYI
jgi:hypothetical protein